MTSTTIITTAEAKDKFIELIDRVAHSKERIILSRRDKEIAAIIPIEDLHQLLASQDKHDLQEAIASLKEVREVGTISLEQLKKEAGI